VNNIPTIFRHVELAQYADDTALIATSRYLSLLVGYLEAYSGGTYADGGLNEVTWVTEVK
jgi:hypothetical protein